MQEENKNPEISEQVEQVPALRWKPADIEPDMDKMMTLSTEFYRKIITPSCPELEFFGSLDLQRLNQWDEQADRALEFYLQVKASIAFARAVYLAITYFNYMKDVWASSSDERKKGKKVSKVGYDLVLTRAVYGVCAHWYRVTFSRQGSKRYRKRTYVHMHQDETYSRESFFEAAENVGDYIYSSIERNLAPLRSQTKDLGILARGLKLYRTHGTKFLQRPQDK